MMGFDQSLYILGFIKLSLLAPRSSFLSSKVRLVVLREAVASESGEVLVNLCTLLSKGSTTA